MDSISRALDALASGDSPKAYQAACDLQLSLCGDRTVTPASLAAIPRMLAALPPPQDGAAGALCLKLLEMFAAMSNGHEDGVAIGDVRAAIAKGVDAFVGVLRSGGYERRYAVAILSGPEFGGAADALEAIARSPKARASERANAWRALGLVAPGRVPPVIDDVPAVRLAASLACLAAVPKGEWASDDVVARAKADLEDVDAYPVLAYSADQDGDERGAPIQLASAHLAGDDPALLPRACWLVENMVTQEACKVAHTLLDASFERSGVRTFDLDAATPKQRAVLASICRAPCNWPIGHFEFSSSMAMFGLQYDISTNAASVGVTGPRAACTIVRPAQVRAACAILPRLRRDAWLHAPFVYFRGFGGFADAIPEDPADFPPKVMRDFRKIEPRIAAMVTQFTGEFDDVAFFPQLTAAGLETIARRLGLEIVPPVLAFADDPYDPDVYRWSEDDDDSA